jgi:hypothetical protein
MHQVSGVEKEIDKKLCDKFKATSRISKTPSQGRWEFGQWSEVINLKN